MVRNYITENDLKAYVPKLDTLLYPGDTDFSLQKQASEIEVMNDFIKRGFKAVYLRNDLTLRDSGTAITEATAEDVSEIDSITRMRWVIDCKTFTGEAKTVTLQGTNDLENYNTITSQEISEVGITSVIIEEFYKYYKVTANVTDGTFDYSSYLTETSYDLLYIFKWLIIILTPIAKDINSPYYILLQNFLQRYADEWNTLKVYYDNSGTGELSALDIYNNTSLNFTR